MTNADSELRPGVNAGTHAYGYVSDGDGECVLRRVGCLGRSTTVCHDRFVCIPCLHVHKHELERDGVEMQFVGTLTDGDDLERVQKWAAASFSVDGPSRSEMISSAGHDSLVRMLHEVWACAVDTGGQTPQQAQEIFDRAKAMLASYGVQV